MRLFVRKIASFIQKHRLRRLIYLYSIFLVAFILYNNPFHFSFLTEQAVLVILWLYTILLFKLSFRWSFFVGLLFIILSAVATALHHPGYAQRFGPFAFWLFVIGSSQRILEAFEQYKPQPPKEIKNEPANAYHVSRLTTVLLILATVIPIMTLLSSWFSFLPLTSGDWVYKYPNMLQFDAPKAWNIMNLGAYNIPFLWVYPLQFFEKLLFEVFHADFGIIEKIVWFLPILFISAISIYIFIRTFGGKLIACIFGILFFFLNTYTILLFAGGQTLFALGYALYPLAFVVVHKATENNRLSFKLLSGLLVALLGFADPRIAFLFLLTSGIYLVYRFLSSDLTNLKSLLNKYITLGFFMYVIPLLLHAYWIIPTFLADSQLRIQSIPTLDTTLNLSFMTLTNAFAVFQPHWPENIFGKTSAVPFVFFIFPFIIYAAPFLIKKPIAWFFVILSLLSAFLTKGVNEPFGIVYPYLSTILPGFALFRDPSKFYVPLILSYTLLFGLVVEHIYFTFKKLTFEKNAKIFGRHFAFPIQSVKIFQLYMPPIFLILMIIFLYWLTIPAFKKTMGGTFVGYAKPGAYEQLYKSIQQDQSFYRSLWLPEKTRFAPENTLHALVNGVDLAQDEPFNAFISNPYHTFTYIDDPASIEFLRMLGIRYLHIVHPNTLRYNNDKDYEGATKANAQMLADLRHREGVVEKTIVPDATTFEIQNTMPHFFPADKVFWLYGSSKAYTTIKTLPNTSLLGNAFIRKETIADIPIVSNELWQAQIIESNFTVESGVLTLPLPRLERCLYIFNTVLDPQKVSLPLRIEGIEGKTMQFMVRRSYDVTPDKEQVYGRDVRYVWQNATITPIPDQLNMYTLSFPESQDDMKNAVVDRIIAYNVGVIPSLELFFQDHKPLPIVETLKSSPTAYTVSIREAKAPFILIFSDAFNNGWRVKLQDKTLIPFPIFNVLNGYILDTQGNYMLQVTFQPQRYVLPFALFSATVFLLLLVYIIVIFYREKRYK